MSRRIPLIMLIPALGLLVSTTDVSASKQPRGRSPNASRAGRQQPKTRAAWIRTPPNIAAMLGPQQVAAVEGRLEQRTGGKSLRDFEIYMASCSQICASHAPGEDPQPGHLHLISGLPWDNQRDAVQAALHQSARALRDAEAASRKIHHELDREFDDREFDTGQHDREREDRAQTLSSAFEELIQATATAHGRLLGLLHLRPYASHAIALPAAAGGGARFFSIDLGSGDCITQPDLEDAIVLQARALQNATQVGARWHNVMFDLPDVDSEALAAREASLHRRALGLLSTAMASSAAIARSVEHNLQTLDGDPRYPPLHALAAVASRLHKHAGESLDVFWSIFLERAFKAHLQGDRSGHVKLEAVKETVLGTLAEVQRYLEFASQEGGHPSEALDNIYRGSALLDNVRAALARGHEHVERTRSRSDTDGPHPPSRGLYAVNTLEGYLKRVQALTEALQQREAELRDSVTDSLLTSFMETR